MKRYSVHNDVLNQTFYSFFKSFAVSCARMLNDNRPVQYGIYEVRKIKTGELVRL